VYEANFLIFCDSIGLDGIKEANYKVKQEAI
jgi:hypothetical protein